MGFHRRWCCPTCGCSLPFQDLILCDFTKHLLNQASADITELPLEAVCGQIAKVSALAVQAEVSSMQATAATPCSSEISARRKRRLWTEDTLVQSQGANR